MSIGSSGFCNRFPLNEPAVRVLEYNQLDYEGLAEVITVESIQLNTRTRVEPLKVVLTMNEELATIPAEGSLKLNTRQPVV